MNVSKTIASTVAALAVAGSVGFAYAQSTTETQTPTDPQATSPMAGQPVAPNSADSNLTTPSTQSTPSATTTPDSSSTTSTPSDSTSTPSTDSSSTSAEPAPQADRG